MKQSSTQIGSQAFHPDFDGRELEPFTFQSRSLLDALENGSAGSGPTVVAHFRDVAVELIECLAKNDFDLNCTDRQNMASSLRTPAEVERLVKCCIAFHNSFGWTGATSPDEVVYADECHFESFSLCLRNWYVNQRSCDYYIPGMPLDEKVTIANVCAALGYAALDSLIQRDELTKQEALTIYARIWHLATIARYHYQGLVNDYFKWVDRDCIADSSPEAMLAH